jgi:hypothetical protein
MSLLPRGYARRAQEIIVPNNFHRSTTNIFLPHHHTQAPEPTIEFVKEYKVDVIVQTRDILDMALSLIDHLTSDGIGVPVAYVPMSFKSEPFEVRAEIVTTLLMPWYVSFYASWAYAEVEHGAHIHVVRYEELVKDTKNVLASCLTFAGEMRNVNVYNRAIKVGEKRDTTRFNKGVIGRGAIELPAACILELRRMVDAHKDPVIKKAMEKIQNYETIPAAGATKPESAPISMEQHPKSPRVSGRTMASSSPSTASHDAANEAEATHGAAEGDPKAAAASPDAAASTNKTAGQATSTRHSGSAIRKTRSSERISTPSEAGANGRSRSR